jgi:ferredoxin-NADP reductase
MPQKILCNVVDVVPHGDRVYTVLLRPTTTPPRFAAGQFLHLALDSFQPGDFWPESRAFSIASAPSQKDLLRITYAVKGQFTRRMENELLPSAQVWAKLPYGEFIVDRQANVCLVAGGTGITAFTALLGELPADHPNQVHLFYGARRPELLIYRQQALDFAARCRNAHVYLFAEECAADDSTIRQGRVDLDSIWDLLPAPLDVTFYIAGPPSMITGLTTGLKSNSVDNRRIVFDTWE